MSAAHQPSAFRPSLAMGPGREFETIRLLTDRWGDLAVDIGDDAAVLPSSALPPGASPVVSVDACVENVHFIRRWITPREVGYRAATAALSDLAAMGATAAAVLVAMMVPASWDADLAAVADGLADPIRAAGARIVGGNLSRGAAFGVTLTVIGHAVRPVSRSGARPGDIIVVTGTLGGPGAAVAAWYAQREPGAWARARFAAPVARLPEGRLLAAAGATAMIDISDGLAADARHLEAAGRRRLDIDRARLPLGPDISAEAGLTSGEEYELLATLPPDAWRTLAAQWPSLSTVPITAIGQVADAPPVEAATGLAGHDHFSASDRIEPPPAR